MEGVRATSCRKLQFDSESSGPQPSTSGLENEAKASASKEEPKSKSKRKLKRKNRDKDDESTSVKKQNNDGYEYNADEVLAFCSKLPPDVQKRIWSAYVSFLLFSNWCFCFLLIFYFLF